MSGKTKTGLIKSSIGKKVFMGLTGLFLCLFLAGHLAGNLQLLLPAEVARDQFNAYAKFMTTNPAVKLLSYLTYFSILFHAVDGLYLAWQNKQARPQVYYKKDDAANAGWASRNMAVLGTLLLVFIVIHMKSFWYEMHFGNVPVYASIEHGELKDLYTLTTTAFTEWWYVLIYVLSMGAVGFHLWHGFGSGFKSLGISHPVYTPLLNGFGKGFAVVVSVLFAILPVYLFLTSLN